MGPMKNLKVDDTKKAHLGLGKAQTKPGLLNQHMGLSGAQKIFKNTPKPNNYVHNEEEDCTGYYSEMEFSSKKQNGEEDSFCSAVHEEKS